MVLVFDWVGGMGVRNAVRVARGWRTSIGKADEVKTGWAAVAHSGAAMTGTSADQVSARRVFVAATERAVAVGWAVRSDHWGAVRVQWAVNGSDSVAGDGNVRTTAPLASTDARRAPVATVEADRRSVACMRTSMVSMAPAEFLVTETEIPSMAGPVKSMSSAP